MWRTTSAAAKSEPQVHDEQQKASSDVGIAALPRLFIPKSPINRNVGMNMEHCALAHSINSRIQQLTP